MKKLFISIIAVSLLSACTEDINVTLPGSQSKVVIEGSIENGKYPEVILTKNIPLFSSVSGGGLTDLFILDARIYVSSNGMVDTLGLTVDSSSSLGLVYKGHTIIGIPGQSYNLTVIAQGNTYTATTTIPAPIALDSVWWKADPPHDSVGFANAHLSDPSGLGNNYRWLAKRPRDRRYIAPGGATFDDKFIDGKSFDFAYDRGYDATDVVNTPENDPDGQRGYYLLTDTIYIKFCTIDRASKDFYTTFETAIQSNGNPFASPVTVLNNINGGGLGVWCGSGVTYDTIYPH
ncbi:MAG: hypothetical protein JWP12_1563 [Bacteroidetes bacterium]|nr:hypothetical protein [Bacteroidota bacterium]